MPSVPRFPLMLLALWAALCGGCADTDFFKAFKPKEEKPPEPAPRPLSKEDPLLGDTVGAKTLLGGAQPLRLRGFGIVVGLGENGGSDCPTSVREYLIEFLGKELTPRSGLAPRRMLSPSKLIDSKDTAVVEVQGVVPAGSPTGLVFDVQMIALGAETRSLAGGVLLPCELKFFQAEAGGRGVIEGRALARAGGAVFTNPFVEPDDSAFAPAQLRGMVLGGGKTLEPRSLRMMLDEPSYAVARRIETRINERFGQAPPIAEAMSRGYIELTTPLRFAERPDSFQQLVAHLTLEGSPEYLERRLVDLSESLASNRDKLPNFSLMWEGMGPRALPTLRGLYGHADEDVRYYAARAGARLEDATALPILAEIAERGDEALRLPAVRELGDVQRPQAADLLLPLLDAADTQVRIAAYEALRDLRHPAVASTSFASVVEPYPLNFKLELVRSSGPPMIYARRTREPRIAVFGLDTKVVTPLFYARYDDRITLNAGAGERDITILPREGDRFRKPVVVPARVVDLIAALGATPDARRGRPGLGLTYSEVLYTIEKLTSDGSIPAEFVLEQATMTDLLGPRRPEPGRRETDEERRESSPADEAEDGANPPPARRPAADGEPQAEPTPAEEVERWDSPIEPVPPIEPAPAGGRPEGA